MAPNRGNKKRNKNKRRLRWDRIILTFLLLAAGTWLSVRGIISCISDKSQTQPVEAELTDSSNTALEELFSEEPNPWENHLDAMPDDGCVKMRINPIGGSLAQVFDDINALHLEAARELGINAVNSEADAWHLRRPIVEIESCREYFVDDLSHSYPFLVPEAAQLLHDIGSEFNRELAARGGGAYRLKVTSVMRTPLTVGRLRRVNRNASAESAHQYATTFDISYGKFICDDDTQTRRTQEDLKNLLAEVLSKLRSEGSCYVKYEYKQACFHITVRP